MKNVKIRAAIEILAFVAFAVSLQYVIAVLATVFTISEIVTAAGVAAMIFCIYQLYQIRVGQLEDSERLDK
jgi:FtsH-binding integral membrane protein